MRSSQAEARRDFHLFIKRYSQDAQADMNDLKNLLMNDSLTLKYQEKLLKERIDLGE